MRPLILVYIFLISGLIILQSCGSDKNDKPELKNQTAEIGSDLTEFELENGIGPIKEKLELGPIDQRLVKQGEEIWNQKCIICHKLDEKFIGPPQRDVLKRRTPEFFINMVLNPDEMQNRHPAIKQLRNEYMAPMTNQNLTFEEARALLEFFREVSK